MPTTTTKATIRECDVGCVKYLQRLTPLLARLRREGYTRDKAGNRELHFDQYGLLVLMSLFNPTATSRRAFQQASELPKVPRLLGCSRAALGSLSEGATLFDTNRLKEVLRELGDPLQPFCNAPRLQDLGHTLPLVDGTMITTLPQLMQASYLKSQAGSGSVKWRLHTHVEVERYAPSRMDVTPKGRWPAR